MINFNRDLVQCYNSNLPLLYMYGLGFVSFCPIHFYNQIFNPLSVDV